MITILACDDEVNILDLYKIRLSHYGYNVLLARNGEEALEKIYENKVDLLIIDVMMPKMDGYQLLEEMRNQDINIPSIMVTAKGELYDKAQGFNLGVDDYLVKPIDFEELLLRVKALLRRYQIVTSHKIEVGNVVLDSATLTITDKTKDLNVTLTKKEFGILFKLLSYPERSFTKEQIFDEFWGFDSSTDIDTIKVFISKIRSQIAVFPEIDIKTIRGIGYRGIRNETKTEEKVF